MVGEIGPGLLVLLGVGQGDTQADAAYLADKTANLRIFRDAEGKMNLSLLDLKAGAAGEPGVAVGAGAAGEAGGGPSPAGEVLVVSQFTLYGDVRRGRRPGYSDAAPPDEADRLYQVYVDEVRAHGLRVATGEFQAMMDVELVNDGPVTILMDSKKVF